MSKRGHVMRVATAIACGLLAGGGAVPAVALAEDTLTAQTVTRVGEHTVCLYGENRYQTMAQVVNTVGGGNYYDVADDNRVVVVASGEEYVSPLVANALASYFWNSRLVLTNPYALSPEAAQIIAARPDAFLMVVGDAIADPVIDQIYQTCKLTKDGYARISGQDPTRLSLNVFATMLGGGQIYSVEQVSTESIKDWVQSMGGHRFNVQVASGYVFADALSLGGVCYQGASPLLLTDAAGNLDAAARASLERMLDAIMGAVSVTGTAPNVEFGCAGGTASVSADTEAYLNSLTQRYPFVTVYHRVGGRDRYETSRLIAQEAYGASSTWQRAVVVTGQNYPDALASGQLAAYYNAPVLLIDSVGDLSAQLLARTGIPIDIVGGEASIPTSLAQALENLVAGK